MSNKILFLLSDGSLNDATQYYVQIIHEAFEKAGYVVSYSNKLFDAKKYQEILTIEAKWFFYAKLVNPSASIINWFQGVVAEEAYLTTNSIFRKKLWQFFEGFTLRYSELNIYVSNQMKLYFEKSYNVKSKKYFVMPCFNKELNLNLVDNNKYLTPTFVYAGSLAKWQCIEQTLELYALLEKELPDASISLLTKEKDYALDLINKYNIQNYNVSYVSLKDLDLELAKYKYGFLLREDHIVNNVATPTKMNSYLSVGIIPIYSDTIFDFNENLKKFKNLIQLNNDGDLDFWVEKIKKFENEKKINNNEMIDNLKNLFLNYYDKESYINKLKQVLEII